MIRLSDSGKALRKTLHSLCPFTFNFVIVMNGGGAGGANEKMRETMKV